MISRSRDTADCFIVLFYGSQGLPATARLSSPSPLVGEGGERSEPDGGRESVERKSGSAIYFVAWPTALRLLWGRELRVVITAHV